ncbi:MAG: hypothetical protein ACRCZ5_05625, partial [Burkholderiales bacterium]
HFLSLKQPYLLPPCGPCRRSNTVEKTRDCITAALRGLAAIARHVNRTFRDTVDSGKLEASIQ